MVKHLDESPSPEHTPDKPKDENQSFEHTIDKQSKDENQFIEYTNTKDKSDEESQETSVNVARPSIGGRKRTIALILLSIIIFLVTAMFAVLAPFFPTLAVARNVNQFKVGLIFAVYPAANFLFSPICGLLLPQVGVTFVLFIGILIESCCSIIFGFLPHILDNGAFVAFCFITRGIQGIGFACYQTASLAMTSSIFTDNVAAATSTLEAFAAIGYMVGPTLGGVLYQAGGFKLPFLVMGSSMFGFGCISIFFLPRIRHKSTSAPTALMKKLLSYPRVLLMCSGITLLMIIFGVLDLSVALHLKPFHLSPSVLGLFFLPLTIAYGVFSPVFGYLSDRWGYRWFIVGGCFGLGIALIFLGPAPFIPIPLSIGQSIPALIGCGAGAAALLTPLYGDILATALVRMRGDVETENADADDDNFATISVVSGVFSAFNALGQVLGPIIGGVAITSASITFDWTMSILGFTAMTEGVMFILLTICDKTVQNSAESTRNASSEAEKTNHRSTASSEVTPLLS